ncbi:rhomboid family intramembrane serine protease [Jeotgalibacillus sp. S-D1]|uniref:rhomboid family intramembrane serine protease n=1 Tax=Jeotgalibacillus sp. S-D1 TaxID=2552189 RepID=UPI00105A79CF|nr:rhomboid family intramembrane serine protease [Jeotgalibacillus sp. S-D1]TDL34544.1 rhomboid family intramembrane serine protease [Jeotgalibacillus sp. S-D1]
MANRVEYLYWIIAHELIVNGGYRLFKISSDQNELWLENDAKKPKIIRLAQVEFQTASQIQQDLNRLTQIGENLRKQLRKRKINIENIYFLLNELPDEESFQVDSPVAAGRRHQTAVYSSLITDQTDPSIWSSGHPLSEIKTSIASEDYDDSSLEEIKEETLVIAHSANEKDRQLFNASTPFFTYVFIVIQLGMFYLLESNGGSTNTQVLIDYGAKYNPLIEQGDWWRFFTPIVLHIGLLHLFMNTLALFYLGPLIERIYGRFRFLFIYLLAGFSGSLMSFVFSYNISAGASGAIFGCFGALLYFGARYPKLFFRTMGLNVLIVIGINIAFGFTVPGIDNAGHLGGLAGGFLAAGIVSLPKQKKLINQTFFFIGAITLILIALYLGYSGLLVNKDPMAINAIAQEEIQSGDYENAYKNLTALRDDGKATAETYFLMSFIELNEKRYEEGVANLKRAIAERHNFHEAHYNLALVYRELEKTQEAGIHAEKALEIMPDHEPYQQLAEELNR